MASEGPPMELSESSVVLGGYKPKFKLGMLGTAAPVFPGFEVDISDRVGDRKKPDAVWHRDRAKRMLRAHPEMKELFGRAPSTAVWCLLFTGLQLGLAAAMTSTNVWVLLAVAWLVGAWINVVLFQLAHECNHCLVFKKPSANRLLFTVTSLPMFLSGHHTWWVEHLVHHNDLGAKKDFITRRRTFFLISRLSSPLFVPYSLIMLVMQVLRSAAGLLLYVFDLLCGRIKPSRFTLAVLADEHLVSGYEKDRISLFAVYYPLLNLAVCGALFWWGGWKPVAYLLMSQAFMTGFLHPFMLGIVLAISHFHGHERYQPSASNYNWLFNFLTFNVGYHVEHHDIAGIPWFRLPKMRRIAPEFYDDLGEIRSYTWLAMKFVFGGKQTFAKDFDNEAFRNAERFAAGEQATAESETDPAAQTAA